MKIWKLEQGHCRRTQITNNLSMVIMLKMKILSLPVDELCLHDISNRVLNSPHYKGLSNPSFLVSEQQRRREDRPQPSCSVPWELREKRPSRHHRSRWEELLWGSSRTNLVPASEIARGVKWGCWRHLTTAQYSNNVQNTFVCRPGQWGSSKLASKRY